MGPTSRLGHFTEHVENVFACNAPTSVRAPYSRTLQGVITTLRMIYLHVFEGNTGMIDCCVPLIFTDLSGSFWLVLPMADRSWECIVGDLQHRPGTAGFGLRRFGVERASCEMVVLCCCICFRGFK
ncbi:unnamed protein product [Ixodes persulcatus]